MGKYDRIGEWSRKKKAEDEAKRVITESISPTGKQALAFAAPDRFVLYGGAMGGGKSTWLTAYGIELSMRYPDNVGYLCRHELSSFRRSTMVTLMEHMPWELVAQHHKTENYFLFKNGSMAYYGGLGDDIKAINRLKSMEIGWFGIDQAEETTEAFFFMLASRLRLKTKTGLRYKGLLTANPEPNWLKSRFIDQKKEDHIFIPALPRDNPHLPGDYEQKLRDLNLPPELLRAWLEGDWNAISSTDTIYPLDEIVAAMQRHVPVKEDDEEEYGMDVAEFGGDETVISRKKGFRFEIVQARPFRDPMESVGEMIRIVNYDKTKRIKVDAIGVGNGVYFRLKELGFNVYPIKGSERPSEEYTERYKNRKAQYHFHLKMLLPYCELPDDEKLKAQMGSIRYRVLSNNIIAIESKAELRRRGLPSPDRLESLIYAAAPVEEEITEGEVYHTGMAEKERKEKEKRPKVPPGPAEAIEEEIARAKKGPFKKEESKEGWENDEGKVFIDA